MNISKILIFLIICFQINNVFCADPNGAKDSKIDSDQKEGSNADIEKKIYLFSIVTMRDDFTTTLCNNNSILRCPHVAVKIDEKFSDGNIKQDTKYIPIMCFFDGLNIKKNGDIILLDGKKYKFITNLSENELWTLFSRHIEAFEKKKNKKCKIFDSCIIL